MDETQRVNELMRHALTDVQLSTDAETDAFSDAVHELTAGTALDDLRTRGVDTVIAVVAAFMGAAQLAASMYQIKLMNDASAKSDHNDKLYAELERKLSELKSLQALPAPTRTSIIGALARRLGLK